jgi:RNA polymerase sigma-70 factor (ECF subfamily)
VRDIDTGSAASGTSSSFDDFYSVEFEPVAALAYVLSGSAVAAEDLAQEAFLAAYHRWGEIGRYDSPGGWVRRVVANRSVSAYRRRAAEARAVARMDHRDSLPDLSPESADVWRAVRALPKRQAQVVALYYLEDRSLDDVADVLAVSVETARTHLRRARKGLARRLRLED